MIGRVALPSAALCILAAFVPWALHAADWTERGVHDGLWFAAAAGVLGLAASSFGGGRVWWILAGALALAVVAIETPTVWSNAFEPPEGAAHALLSEYARAHLLAYGAALLGGIGMLGAGLRPTVGEIP